MARAAFLVMLLLAVVRAQEKLYEMCVISANLPDVDPGYGRGQSDPYAQLFYDGVKKFQTRTESDDNTPI